MQRFWLTCLIGAAAILPAARPALPPTPGRVVVIPVRDEIADPAYYFLRRGLKTAAAEGATWVILDVKTPGGSLDTTFQMLEAIAHFPGHTIAYVDDEAMSAGAILSAATDEIWFAPKGVIGAAAPVSSTGQDIDFTMKEKLVSYLTARMRAITADKGYRGQVVSAMIDADYELTVDGKVLKAKGGGLLSLTAAEAMKPYGHPPRPLLGAGIASSVEQLVQRKWGAGPHEVERLRETWSESLAVWLTRISPVLLGLGLFALFIAFKTQSFGGFGAAGVALLGIVFLGSYVAGLSGHEPAVVFCLGVILLMLELIFFHSAGFLGAVGLAMILGALVWSMADLWPQEPIRVAWDANAFVRPFVNLGLGAALAIALGLAALRFLPRGWVWDRLVIGATVGGVAQAASTSPDLAGALDGLVGRKGIAATALRPGGQVEVDGRRYEAAVPVGAIDAGQTVIVRGRRDFSLLVESADV